MNQVFTVVVESCSESESDFNRCYRLNCREAYYYSLNYGVLIVLTEVRFFDE